MFNYNFIFYETTNNNIFLLKFLIIKEIQTINSLKKLQKDEFIVHHHLGLGDHIICNGLVNFISKKYKKIYLVTNSIFKDQVDYLYQINNRVEILPVDVKSVNNAEDAVKDFAMKKKLQILKIGFEEEKKINKPFYKAFYKQLNINYKISYSDFNLPFNQKDEVNLSKILFKKFNVKNSRYLLFHNEASDNKFQLNIQSNLPVISLSQDYDDQNNIFLYRDIIKNASEIHCINSSFLHLIDRIETNGRLFYHNIRGSKIKLRKKWRVLTYGNRN